jgi:hypothetical protein
MPVIQPTETGSRMQVILAGATTTDLRSGDQLLSVAGVDVANTFDVERAFWGMKPCEQVPYELCARAQSATVMLTLGSNEEAGHVVDLGPMPARSSANDATSALLASEPP